MHRNEFPEKLRNIASVHILTKLNIGKTAINITLKWSIACDNTQNGTRRVKRESPFSFAKLSIADHSDPLTLESSYIDIVITGSASRVKLPLAKHRARFSACLSLLQCVSSRDCRILVTSTQRALETAARVPPLLGTVAITTRGSRPTTNLVHDDESGLEELAIPRGRSDVTSGDRVPANHPFSPGRRFYCFHRRRYSRRG